MYKAVRQLAFLIAAIMLISYSTFALSNGFTPRATNSFTYNTKSGTASCDAWSTGASATTNFGYGPYYLDVDLTCYVAYGGSMEQFSDSIGNAAYSVTASVNYTYSSYAAAYSDHYVNDTLVQNGYHQYVG